MNEKFARLCCVLLVVLAADGSGVASAVESAPNEVPTTEPVATPVETQPPITANEFFPEDRNVTDCVGAVERPGCGNENRGGWRQTLVFVAVVGGLFIVFGNVVRSVRRRQRS